MHDKPDKGVKPHKKIFIRANPDQGPFNKGVALNKKRKRMRRMKERCRTLALMEKAALRLRQGFDPELLYVECEKCGSPVIWEPGHATKLLAEAGIDPLELDAFCLLLTDGCPACGTRSEYAVRIFRIASQGGPLMPQHGHA